MQIGFNAPTSGALIEPDSLRRIITEGEALGFDYTTVSDHIMVPRNLELEISLHRHAANSPPAPRRPGSSSSPPPPTSPR